MNHTFSPYPSPPIHRRTFLQIGASLVAAGLTIPAALAQQQTGIKPVFYPLHAIHTGLEGSVKVYAEISPEGHAATTKIESSSGHEVLDQGAEGSIHTWVFKENLPENMRRMLIPIEFKISEATKKDLPRKNKHGQFAKRPAKHFYPYRADERGMEDKFDVLAEISPDGFARKVSLIRPGKYESLSKCALAFALLESFGGKGAAWEAVLPYEFRITAGRL